MAEGFKIELDPAGVAEVRRLLNSLPEKVGDRAVVSAMKKAIEPARLAAVANVKDRTGALADAIKTRTGKKTREGAPEVVISTRGAKTQIMKVPGSRNPKRVNPRFYLHLVLLGTAAGRRVAGVGKVAKKRADGSPKRFVVPMGNRFVERSEIYHPGGRPNPIFDKALRGPVREQAYRSLISFILPRLKRAARKHGVPFND